MALPPISALGIPAVPISTETLFAAVPPTNSLVVAIPSTRVPFAVPLIGFAAIAVPPTRFADAVPPILGVPTLPPIG